jgi:circadian clock protein KaiC
MRRDVIKTGIAGLDEMLGGGLTRGGMTALSGPTGCGKSTLAMQFLVNGAEKYSEPGIYIALEENKPTVYAGMSGYKWNLQKLESDKTLLFLDYPIEEADQFLQTNNSIEELISTMDIERAVVDSVMPIALLFQNDDERKRGFLKLMANLRKWGTTTIIVSEDTPATTQDVLPRTKYGLESLCDSWMHMYYLYGNHGERQRAIEVLKMKGSAHLHTIVPVTIGDYGINVDLTEKQKK